MMMDWIYFILSRFFVSGLNGREIKKLSFILSKIFPPGDISLSFRRLKNIIFSFLSWRKGIILGEIKPSILQVETVKGCNFNCLMCRAGEHKKEFMSLENFRKVLDRFPEAFVAILNLSGEPFLSKDTLKIARYASYDRHFIVNIFSNFSVLPDPDEVLTSGFYEIHASIDTFNQEKFGWIREGGDLKKVVGNLEKLVEAKRKKKMALPIISINAVATEETVEDAEDIIKNAIKIGVDRVKFQRLLFDVPGLHVPKSYDVFFALKKKYRGRIEVVLNNFESPRESYKGYCYLAYFMIAVLVDGTTLPCCMPYPFFFLKEAYMGNAFYNFSNTKRMNFIRGFRKSPPQFCKICPIYRR